MAGQASRPGTGSSPRVLQPWFARPRPLRSTYSRNPSPSLSAYSTNQREGGLHRIEQRPRRHREPSPSARRRGGRRPKGPSRRPSRNRPAATCCRPGGCGPRAGSCPAPPMCRRSRRALTPSQGSEGPAGEVGAERQRELRGPQQNRPNSVRNHGLPPATNTSSGASGSASARAAASPRPRRMTRARSTGPSMDTGSQPSPSAVGRNVFGIGASVAASRVRAASHAGRAGTRPSRQSPVR